MMLELGMLPSENIRNVCEQTLSKLGRLNFLLSKETEACISGRVKQKFGFIKEVDKR